MSQTTIRRTVKELHHHHQQRALETSPSHLHPLHIYIPTKSWILSGAFCWWKRKKLLKTIQDMKIFKNGRIRNFSTKKTQNEFLHQL
jgi:hypothetical protein